MTIALAQVRSEKGDLARNVERHLAALRALGRGADLVVFPELSLSNYDPDVAHATAVARDDDRLTSFQQFADGSGTAVAVGAPLRTAGKPVIALLVFAAGRPVTVVGKRHLHEDERPFFSPSPGDDVGVLDLGARVGVAICYEISVPAHADALAAAGATVYLASVAKTPAGMIAARATLAGTARKHGIPALLVNSVGTCEGKAAGGGSLVIDRQGRLVCALAETEEGLLIYESDSRTASPRPLPPFSVGC